MKKLLLAPALLLALSSANAQLALQNFNAAGTPAGWSMFSDGNPVLSTISPAYIVPLLNSNAWAKFIRTTGDSAMISTSFMNTAGTKADRWLVTPSFNVTSPTMVISFDISELSSAGTSPIEIMVSTTGGATKADFTTSLGTITSPLGWAKRAASIGAYNGQNVKIAFVNNGTDKGFPGIDNVQTEVMPNALDAQLNGITFPEIVAASASSPVSMTISNQGAANITSVEVSYKVDAGTPVVQTFTGLNITPFGTATINFTTPITGTTSGAHTLLGTITKVNTVADPVATNNTQTITFVTASKSVQRNGLIEEFTSSTCPPCASFNATFDPFLLSIPANVPSSNFNVIKYQMNWPSPGNDVCYNSEGNARKTYYSVSGIPDHYTNGGVGANGDAAEVAASKSAPAFMDITGTYTVKKDSLVADITITPHFTQTGGNYRVHMASLEYNYTNLGATTSQKQYYHVMRNMVGMGAGLPVTSWTDGVPQKFRWAYKYTVATPAQFNNNFWGSPFSGSLVAFVQNNNNKTVLQSKAIPTSWPTAIENVSSVISQSSVYPNPATDHTTIAFLLESSASVGVQVVDAMGRVVYSIAEQKMNAGTQVVEINTTSFAAGIYTIKVQAENGSISERFSVIK